MKTKITVSLFIAISVSLVLAFKKSPAHVAKDPWTKNQLIQPSELAAIITDSLNKPLILAVNPDGMYNFPVNGGIKGAVWLGPASEKVNFNALKAYLKNRQKSESIVIYCGCCPFDVCPNIRPAWNLLKKMKFRNAKLLNLSNNIKTDWIDKGYPMNF